MFVNYWRRADSELMDSSEGCQPIGSLHDMPREFNSRLGRTSGGLLRHFFLVAHCKVDHVLFYKR